MWQLHLQKMHSRDRKLGQIQDFTHDDKNRTKLILTCVIVVVIIPPPTHTA